MIHGVHPMTSHLARGTAPLLTLPRQSLAVLRRALIRDLGGRYATYLQEAGYAGGESVFAAFCEWLAGRNERAQQLSFAALQARASEFFADTGWGALTIGTLNDVVLTLDATDWAEADPSLGIGFPACYFSMELLADFFRRLADAPLACYEVECRSAGAAKCRFLLGSPEVIGHIYQRMTAGGRYDEAVAELT